MAEKCPGSSMRFEILLEIVVSFLVLQTGFATDIEVLDQLIDSSLGYDVLLPELACHAKYDGYHKVFWYKDNEMIKNSSAAFSGPLLYLGSLLEKFHNPLNLQGYYWCETDLNHTESPPNKYLFKIANVHTYVAKILAKNDYIISNDTINSEESQVEKASLYEEELENILFSFLPKPNVFVTNLKDTKKGLEVKFFLYVAESFPSNVPSPSRLIADKEQLGLIYVQLQNQKQDNEHVEQWKKHQGISLVDLKIYSTACYAQSFNRVEWPDAEIGEIVVPKDGCSQKNGLAVTRRCSGTFTDGAKWGPIRGVCEEIPAGLTKELIILSDKLYKQDPSSTIKGLEIWTDSPKLLKTVDLHFVATALEFVSKTQLTHSDVEIIFTVVNNILHANRSTMEAAKYTLALSSRVINAIENVMQLSSVGFKDTAVSKSEIVVKTKNTDTEDTMMVGAALLSSPKESSSKASSLMSQSTEFLMKGSKLPAQSLAGFIVPTELILERFLKFSHPCKLKTIFFHDWTLFPSLKTLNHHPINAINENVDAPVIYVGLSGGPAWNLSKPVKLFFKNHFEENDESPTCVYFEKNLNDGFGGWATDGCYFSGFKKGFYRCSCHHLSTFSIILSKSPSDSSLKVGTSIYTGCGISILALVPVILLFAMSKMWRKGVDHYLFFFLGLGLICSFILLLLHGVKSTWKPGCMLLSVLFYYFMQATFCWSLIIAIAQYLKLARNSNACETPNFIIRSAVFAWDFPLLVVGLIWVVKGSDYYEHKYCWLTMIKLSTIVCYPVIILLLMTFGFHMLTTYKVACHFNKDMEFFGKEQKENTVKFRISFSIFIFFSLLWIFGYLSLHYKPIEYRILFGVSAVVTSIYILLFFVFNDASARQLLLKEPKAKNPKTGFESTDAISCEVKSYDAT